ncbi:MAG: helix-turn-helix domain-containing protein [Streptococcus sp.]
MMDFKTELGQKVQTLRESKGLSRQAICGIEDLLTTRQLQRIEKGQSLPTIATAKYC